MKEDAIICEHHGDWCLSGHFCFDMHYQNIYGINDKNILCLAALFSVAVEAHFFHLSLMNSSEFEDERNPQQRIRNKFTSNRALLKQVEPYMDMTIQQDKLCLPGNITIIL